MRKKNVLSQAFVVDDVLLIDAFNSNPTVFLFKFLRCE